MKNADYWRGRFSILEDTAFKRSEQSIRAIEQMYLEAERSVQKEIEAWYGRFAVNNQISLADARKLLTAGQLEEFRWTVDQYIQAGKKAGLDAAWLKRLENASAKVHISRLEAVQMEIQQQLELLYGNQVDEIDSLLKKVVGGGYTHTAFEIQKGLGLGWDLVALDQRKLETFSSKPWTTDGRTFRDRCWMNKAELVDSVHKNLVQGMLRGDSPEKTIQAIQKQFGVSRYKARRLVHTETSYFNAQAAKEAYKDLDIEKIEILGALDSRTCSLCGEMDGKVITLAQYKPGVTALPWHPNCRCTTCPYYDDMGGERASRNAGGEVYYVPASMTYAEWKDAFVDGGAKTGLTEIFRSMRDYIKPDGSFDLEATRVDYEKFLQSVPEKNRIYLEQAMNGVEYRQTDRDTTIIAYDPGRDAILFNPAHPFFKEYDFQAVNTHELGHRIDHMMFIQSWTSEAYSAAIAGARVVIDADPQKFLKFAEGDEEGFLSDILSAICEDDYRFPAYHEKQYWLNAGNKEKELFANLFSLEAFKDEEKLIFLKDNFPDIFKAYNELFE